MVRTLKATNWKYTPPIVPMGGLPLVSCTLLQEEDNSAQDKDTFVLAAAGKMGVWGIRDLRSTARLPLAPPDC